MARYFKCVLFFFVFISVDSYGEQLDISQLKAFNELILKETKESQENIIKYLSDELMVEANLGTDAQGVTLYYNKAEYIDLIKKSHAKVKKYAEGQEIDVFGFKIISKNKGEFTIKFYSKIVNRSVWSVITVELVEGKIQIIKIVESA